MVDDEGRDGLDLVFAEVSDLFDRVEPRRQARAYVTGLLTSANRKNSWELARLVGDPTPDRMQRLLNSARWDADLMRDRIRALVVSQLAEADGVLAIGDVGFPKKGTNSAGVQRQITESGRVENCQLGVFLAYAGRDDRSLIDRELYLPKRWIADPARCVAAGIPLPRRYLSRPALAAAMLGRAFDARVPARWVTAGELYGQDAAFRRFLDRRGVNYVLAVPGGARLADYAPGLAAGLGGGLPLSNTVRLPLDGGARFDWALCHVPGAAAARGQWLLLRRSTANPEDLAGYVCAANAGTMLHTFVSVLARASAVELAAAEGRARTGLDHYQVRGYVPWYRHVTLAMLAQAYLHLDPVRRGSPGQSPGDPNLVTV